jgi:roadblock/LC7 domain-containing protein
VGRVEIFGHLDVMETEHAIGKGAVMRVRISSAAAAMLLASASGFTDKVGSDYVPVVVWIIQDTGDESSVPRLGLGFIEEKLVDSERFLVCDDSECSIAQHIPDGILHRYSSPYIDIEDGALVLTSKER